MKYRVTTNGGTVLMRGVSLETAQATVLANRSIPVYVRSNCPTHTGWVFELIGGTVIAFTWFGMIQDDNQAEIHCPWMLTLRRAVLRAIDPITNKEPQSND